jgi:DNA-binding NarL/FixJ family response regulator
MNFADSLERHIDKLVGTLKDEEGLKEVLKRKFTKKEYKVFVSIEEGNSIEETAKTLNEEIDRVEEIYKKACKKVNQELFKKELVDIYN